jgi:CRP-like cAMP-binding protein
MDRHALVNLLEQNPWFAALPPALKSGILREGRLRRMNGGMIYMTGDAPNGLYALISGEVRSVRVTAEGRSALLMVGHPGTWFGESSMLDGEPRNSEAHAVGETTLLQLTPAGFKRLTENNLPHFACFVQLLSLQYRRAVDYIVNMSHEPLPVRTAQLLCRLAGHSRKTQDGHVIDVKLSQADMAATLNVSRQTLNKQLKQLEADGLIAVAYTQITIRRRAALERLAHPRTPIAV